MQANSFAGTRLAARPAWVANRWDCWQQRAELAPGLCTPPAHALWVLGDCWTPASVRLTLAAAAAAARPPCRLPILPALRSRPPRSRRAAPAPARALFGFGKKKERELTWREQEREEQIAIQQEVLARR